MLYMLRDQASTSSLRLPSPISLARDERAAASGPVRIKRGPGLRRPRPHRFMRIFLGGERPSSWEIPVRAGPWFTHIINCMRRLAQLIRDLFSVKCSETEALRRLLRSEPMAAMPRKLGASGGGLIGTTSGIVSAIWVAVTDLIVYCKIAISRRRA